MLSPFLTSKLVNWCILVCQNVNPPSLALRTCIYRRRLLTSNYKRNPYLSKFYSPQLAFCHSGFYDCLRAKALGQSNALVPQTPFRAVKSYFTVRFDTVNRLILLDQTLTDQKILTISRNLLRFYEI
jgi:hypothetical protein